MVNISVNRTAIYGSTESPITSGSVGLKAQFTFDESWNNLIKIAVFSCGDITKDIQLDNIYECDIPWEILVHDNVGKPIRVGICGLYENEIVYPTIYTDVGKLLQGTRVSEDPPVDYTPTPTEQAITAAKNAVDIANSVREDADNGVFNGKDGEDGKSAYEVAVQNGFVGTEQEWLDSLVGATFIPSLSGEGVLSWTNDKGLDNPEAVNIKGGKGDSPIKGVDYWTEADIAEIKSYVDDAILGGEW